jgi:hypothetical protein
MSTIVEVITQQPTVTIEIISQQALTTVETNSFRSVPLGVNLTAEGDGDNYLSDDGTYKPISGSQINSDWNSVSGVSQILNKPTLGTASSLNVSASGDAASGEVVKGNDTRLSDARTPTTHSHTTSDVTGLQGSLDGKQPLATVLTNTTASFTTTLETKLNGIATGATVNSSDATLLSRANHTGTQLASTISDFNTAADARVVAGITGKENTVAAGTTAQYWRGDKSWQTLDKSAVGLSNVDNTSDANKAVSTATQTALNLKYDASNPSGYTTNLGTVTTSSVVSANGFAGSVATAGTTPAITISTSVTGLLKGNGTAISTATAGTDYLTPTGNGGSLTNFTSGQITTALGFTPYSATNPSGYTTNTGTVTTASIVSANGFSGSVTNASTTPAITISLQDANGSQSGKLTSTDWNTFNGKQDTLVSGTSIKTVNGESLLGSGDVVISGGSGISLTEVEVDFGSKPTKSKKFTIIDASITGSGKIIVSPSGNVATGRFGDDWEWDSISTSAKAGTGQFTLTCFASGKVAGKRKFYYTYQ